MMGISSPGRLFFQQIDLIGQRVALAAAHGAGELAVISVFARFAKAKAWLHGRGRASPVLGIDSGVVRFVFPAAGVGAGALVGVAPVEVARQQAAARVGNAQRAVHEHSSSMSGGIPGGFFNPSSESSRDRMMRDTPLFAKTSPWRSWWCWPAPRGESRCRPPSFTMAIKPGSAMMKASGLALDHRFNVAQVGAYFVVIAQSGCW